MKQTWIKHFAGITAMSAMLAGQTARADYGKLLETLRDNGTITAEQAESLRAQRIRPAGGFVQDMQVRGRVQTQFGYTTVDNDEGSSDYSTFEVRRARIGLRSTLMNSYRAQLEANLVPGSSLSMRSAFIEWRANREAYVKAGFDKPFSTLEENTSSAAILTVERTMISNMVAPGPMTGLSVSGDLNGFFYGVGIYNDQQNRNPANEKSEYLLNLHAGFNLDGMLGEGSKLKVLGSYLTSDDDSGRLSFDDVYAIGFHYNQGAFDLRAEYIHAENGSDDTNGFYIMPSVKLSSNLEGVFRYEYAESDKPKGLRAASRYARNAEDLGVRDSTDDAPGFDPQRGDEYWAAYIGLNYYLQGNGNKLMLGLEFSELDNTDAGTLEATTIYGAWRTLF